MIHGFARTLAISFILTTCRSTLELYEPSPPFLRGVPSSALEVRRYVRHEQSAHLAFAFAPAHEEPRSGSNNSERESTSGRSTNYVSGHLILVFRDIGRIFSLLFLSRPPVARWSRAGREGVQKRK